MDKVIDQTRRDQARYEQSQTWHRGESVINNGSSGAWGMLLLFCFKLLHQGGFSSTMYGLKTDVIIELGTMSQFDDAELEEISEETFSNGTVSMRSLQLANFPEDMALLNSVYEPPSEIDSDSDWCLLMDPDYLGADQDKSGHAASDSGRDFEFLYSRRSETPDSNFHSIVEHTALAEPSTSKAKRAELKNEHIHARLKLPSSISLDNILPTDRSARRKPLKYSEPTSQEFSPEPSPQPAVKKVSTKSLRRRRARFRSKAGCWVCRLKHKKCDEVRPVCKNCAKQHIHCSYDAPRPDFMRDPAARRKKLEEIRRIWLTRYKLPRFLADDPDVAAEQFLGNDSYDTETQAKILQRAHKS